MRRAKREEEEQQDTYCVVEKWTGLLDLGLLNRAGKRAKSLFGCHRVGSLATKNTRTFRLAGWCDGWMDGWTVWFLNRTARTDGGARETEQRKEMCPVRICPACECVVVVFAVVGVCARVGHAKDNQEMQ